MSWSLASRRSSPRLTEQLKLREWRHVGLTSRLKERGGVGWLGRTGDGQLWVKNSGSDGCLYFTHSGLLLPAFDTRKLNRSDADFFERLLRSRRSRLFSITGMEDPVLCLEEGLGEKPLDAENYRQLTGEQRITAASMAGNLSIRRAHPSNLNLLWPLERAYQIEEVLRPYSRLDELSIRQNFLRTLRQQLVYYAVRNGYPVAKAGTNSRGWGWDQIGGVYVVPEHRGQGVARAVMEKLLDAIETAGKFSCLFVKESNILAMSLYRHLGFRDRGRFRISYWV